MIVKVEALFDVKEGQLPMGINPIRFLVEKLEASVPDNIIRIIIIEVNIPSSITIKSR